MKRNEMNHERTATMTIRWVGDADRAAVELLAQRDSAHSPDGALLGVEIGGRLVAVTSLADGHTISDPFSPTREARAMLELRAAQLRHPARLDGRGRGIRLRLPGRSRASLPASPPGAGGRLLTLPSE
jgi:hypothetical protein